LAKIYAGVQVKCFDNDDEPMTVELVQRGQSVEVSLRTLEVALE
jgi:hypothetical protein